MDPRLARIGEALTSIGQELMALAGDNGHAIDETQQPAEAPAGFVVEEPPTLPAGATLERSMIERWLVSSIGWLCVPDTLAPAQADALKLARTLLEKLRAGADQVPVERIAREAGLIDATLAFPPDPPNARDPLLTEEDWNRQQMRAMIFIQQQRDAAEAGNFSNVPAPDGAHHAAIGRWGGGADMRDRLRSAIGG